MSFTLPEKTVQVLKNFSQLNPSMILQSDRLEVISTHKSTIGRYVFDEPLDFSDEIGIYDSSEFLGILSFYKNPEIKNFDKYVTITEGNSKATYFKTAKELLPKVLVQQKFTPDDIKARLDKIGCELQFTLTAEKINMLIKMASIMKSEFVFFETDESKIRITVGNELESSNNNWEITIDSENITNNSLENPVKLSVMEFKFVPSDYDVKVSSKGMSYWKSVSGIEYFIAVTTI
jgi:hypothetical protein